VNDNSDKIILDLCGGTGAWSRPYKETGYDVRLITLPDNDVRTYEPPENVYGILAAPPCTEFSSEKNGHGNRNIDGAMEIVSACERIIRLCVKRGSLKFWALENPVARSSPFPLAKFLGRPSYKFEQWQFGEKTKKATYIWGFFNGPAPSTIIAPTEFETTMGSKVSGNMHYKHPRCPDWCKEYIKSIKGSTARRAALRAITPAGFAEAFFKANK
jgi:hypothetical protein